MEGNNHSILKRIYTAGLWLNKEEISHIFAHKICFRTHWFFNPHFFYNVLVRYRGSCAYRVWFFNPLFLPYVLISYGALKVICICFDIFHHTRPSDVREESYVNILRAISIVDRFVISWYQKLLFFFIWIISTFMYTTSSLYRDRQKTANGTQSPTLMTDS